MFEDWGEFKSLRISRVPLWGVIFVGRGQYPIICHEVYISKTFTTSKIRVNLASQVSGNL